MRVWVAKIHWREDRAYPSIALFSSEAQANAWVLGNIRDWPPQSCGCCGYGSHSIREVELDTGKCL